MSVDFGQYGLSVLANYHFKEDANNINSKRYNVEHNDELLAVRTDKDGTQSLDIIDKKLITLKNRIKAFFNRGPLARLDYSMFRVGTFVTSKCKEIYEKTPSKSAGKRDSFEERVTVEEKDRPILDNIYAIANRMNLVATHRNSDLFNLVSINMIAPSQRSMDKSPKTPRVLRGRTTDISNNVSLIKYNPGINGRFLTLQIQQIARTNFHSAQIRLSAEVGARFNKVLSGPIETTKVVTDFERGSLKGLNDRILKEEIPNLIVWLK